MSIDQDVTENVIVQALEFEKDPRFVQYMKMRLDKAIDDREAGRLIDADDVFADIRDRHGW